MVVTVEDFRHPFLNSLSAGQSTMYEKTLWIDELVKLAKY